MKELNKQQKVALLEKAVRHDDYDRVKSLFDEHKEFEFTARALGLACRYSGIDMVRLLVDHGASFDYTSSPAFTKKYNCKEKISNSFSYDIEYLLYLLPDRFLSNETANIVSDQNRIDELNYLYKKKAVIKKDKKRTKSTLKETNLVSLDGKKIPIKVNYVENVRREHGSLQELLYYAILYNDVPIIAALKELKVVKISKIRADIIRGKANDDYDKGELPYFQNEFISLFTSVKDSNELYMKLSNLLQVLNAKKIDFPPRFFREEMTGPFNTIFCERGVFEAFVTQTNICKAVGKADIFRGLIEHDNVVGLQMAADVYGEPIAKKTLDKYIELSASENRTEATTWFLEYKHKHYGI